MIDTGNNRTCLPFSQGENLGLTAMCYKCLHEYTYLYAYMWKISGNVRLYFSTAVQTAQVTLQMQFNWGEQTWAIWDSNKKYCLMSVCLLPLFL